MLLSQCAILLSPQHQSLQLELHNSSSVGLPFSDCTLLALQKGNRFGSAFQLDISQQPSKGFISCGIFRAACRLRWQECTRLQKELVSGEASSSSLRGYSWADMLWRISANQKYQTASLPHGVDPTLGLQCTHSVPWKSTLPLGQRTSIGFGLQCEMKVCSWLCVEELALKKDEGRARTCLQLAHEVVFHNICSHQKPCQRTTLIKALQTAAHQLVTLSTDL